ncbi:MAG: hypothetical protein K9J37_07075 [Saprospiraceae bacterium]|nr:hypothetical protein [Saprospiraceae bacterium]MCF8249658.1 hypothetical protein [Saprospiraceae bacterium]MCF8279816.1 hypothetical protein [Bacteroidales bacterium]MCF8312355.1 hypothetical protein [Saprospiraceae bacterium]MCF8440648.1 hypothetical protein [Saprospiraceae bacterium]
MKVVICILSVLAVTFQMMAQSVAIKKLEGTTQKLNGEDYLNNSLTLADWLYKEGYFQKSADWAEKAVDTAKKLNKKDLLSISLNQLGRSQMRIPTKGDVMRHKAYNSLKDSNDLTDDTEVKLDNLKNMKELATQFGKKKDLERIEHEMAVLNGNGAKPSEPSFGGLFSRRKKAEAAYEKAQAQNEQLAATVIDLAQKTTNLANQQQGLQKLVAAKEAAIQNMTAAQIKQQLLVSEQSRILDSMKFVGVMDSMKLAQQALVVDQQKAQLSINQAELELRNSQRNLLLAVMALGLLIAGAFFMRYLTISKHNAVLSEKNRIIEDERKRSEELLLNILPASIAEELKKNGSAEARHYESATVLFTDFKGFSAISKQLTAEKLVKDLHHAFKNFDRIIEKHGLEKIKTIGDAYMCAGGLPKKAGHPRDVVKAALEIQQFLKSWNKEKIKAGESPFEARIGIHTGPLVAGVVGSRKFAYDIWGDTVNVASRMETAGEVGLVNISASTHKFVESDFKCEYRGKVPAKNVGEVEMYFIRE